VNSSVLVSLLGNSRFRGPLWARFVLAEPDPTALTLRGTDVELFHGACRPVEKRTVPKERVRLGKDTVTDEREISEEVRKERIDSDGHVR
jgi:hypothetical protein